MANKTRGTVWSARRWRDVAPAGSVGLMDRRMEGCPLLPPSHPPSCLSCLLHSSDLLSLSVLLFSSVPSRLRWPVGPGCHVHTSLIELETWKTFTDRSLELLLLDGTLNFLNLLCGIYFTWNSFFTIKQHCFFCFFAFFGATFFFFSRKLKLRLLQKGQNICT